MLYKIYKGNFETRIIEKQKTSFFERIGRKSRLT